MQHYVFVIYDSITNSVFASQVFKPLVDHLEQNQAAHVTLISYEYDQLSENRTAPYRQHPRLSLIIMQRTRFYGIYGLMYAARSLRSILTSLPSYRMTARGPLAGIIATRAITPACSHLVIQARGLAAQEYRYTHQSRGLTNMWHWIRAKQYEEIERKAYRPYNMRITIEAVSTALKEYLIATFGTPSDRITIAQQDIPTPITAEQKNTWRAAIRKKLSIDDDTYVYCYSGSAKAWQCPKEVISFFTKQLTLRPNSLLLILTTDSDAFTQLIGTMSPSHYRILSVKPEQVYEYLSASDAGLLFRERHIINWVSRPTKLLEYEAVGLPVIHNNTIALLSSSNQS